MWIWRIWLYFSNPGVRKLQLKIAYDETRSNKDVLWVFIFYIRYEPYNIFDIHDI